MSRSHSFLINPNVTPKAFGDPSLLEKLGIVVAMVKLWITLGWIAIKYPFTGTRSKSFKRGLVDTAFRELSNLLNMRQTQYLTGTTYSNYVKWAKKSRYPVVVDDINSSTRLLWIGEKNTERVVLYFHGGAYFCSVQDYMISYWSHIRAELKSQYHTDIGFAILEYSLVPTAGFPTQLTQAQSAIQHLLDIGVKPSNIQIVGDSAGGNLALSVISHLLHPRPSVPSVNLQTPLNGLYVMSPYVMLRPKLERTSVDLVHADSVEFWVQEVLRAAGVVETGSDSGSQDTPSNSYHELPRAFLQPSTAPEDWFSGIEQVIERVLVTTGGAEGARDDIKTLGELIKHGYGRGHADGVNVFVEPGGTHVDPIIEDMIGHTPGGSPSEINTLILEWMANGFSLRNAPS